MVPVAVVIPVQTWGVVQVDDENVEVTVIVIVCDGRPACRFARQKIRGGVARDFLKFSVAQIRIEFLALKVFLSHIEPIHLRIDVTVRELTDLRYDHRGAFVNFVVTR